MPNSKGNADFREKNQAALEKKYRALKTPFERYQFISRFAAATAFGEMLPGVEEYIRNIAGELGREIVSLGAEELTVFEDQVAEFHVENHLRSVEELTEYKRRVDQYKENPQGDPPVYEMSDSVVAIYQSSPMNVLLGTAMNVELTQIMGRIGDKMTEKHMAAWTDKDMTPDQAEEAVATKLSVIDSILQNTLRHLERDLGIKEEDFQRQRMEKQKAFLEEMLPETSSPALYAEDLEDKRKGLDPDTVSKFPGDTGLLNDVLATADNYINFFKNHPDLDIRTLDGNREFLQSEVQRALSNALHQYIDTIPREGLTDEQMDCLMKLDKLVRPILPGEYADVTKALRPPYPGYENLGSPDYQVKTGVHGSFTRIFDEASGVYYEEYNVSESLADPQAVTLPNGKQGLVYNDEPFDMKSHLQAVLKKIIARKPNLAPYLRLNEEAMADVLNPASDEGTALNDFQQAFNPSVTVGMNKRYALPSFGMTAEKYFLPGPKGKTVDQVPEFAGEFQGLLEEFYAAAATQRMLNKAKLLDADGKTLSAGSAHEAMGEIADLLGLGDMVAPTERVPVEKNGRTVFVTFAPKVEGKSILDPESKNVFLNRDTNPLLQPEGMKQLSDMQVLDFICGTYNSAMDKNLVFRTDPEHPEKIGNIVRQNPGTAFGILDANNAAHFENEAGMITDLTRPAALRVVTRSTADRVMAMTDEDIRKVMSGKGFQTAQIDAAINRFHILKEGLSNPSDEIRDGAIHIMEDEEWVKRDPGELMRDLVMSDTARQEYAQASPERKQELERSMFDPAANTNVNNIFRKALATTDQAKAFVKSDRVLRGNLNPALRNVKGFEKKIQPAPLRSISLKELSAEANRNDPWYVSGSDQFKNMKRAMAEYTMKFVEFSQRWKENGGYRSPEEIKTLSDLMDKVGKSADSYVEYKDRTGVKGRTGPGRYAYAQSLREYARNFKRQLDRSTLTTTRKIESISQFYGPNGPDRDLIPAYTEGKVIQSPQDLDVFTKIELPKEGIHLEEDDFASIAYTMAHCPKLTGKVRLQEGSKEITPEENVIANCTIFTTDLGMKTAGQNKVIVPRENVHQYFRVIQDVRVRAGEDLMEAASGDAEKLAEDLAAGLEIFAKSDLMGNAYPLGQESLSGAKLVYKTVEFLERNPKIMAQCRTYGLQESTITMLKAKYHAAELYDRNELATRRLADEEKHPLTPQQKAECLRDQKMYQLLSEAVGKEVSAITEAPEYKNRFYAAGEAMTNAVVAAAKEAPEVRANLEYIYGTRLNLAQKQGLGMPKAMLSLANGLGKFKQQVERQMQQPHEAAPVVQGPSVSV